MAGQAQVGGGPDHGRGADVDGEGDEEMEERGGSPAYPLEGIDGR